MYGAVVVAFSGEDVTGKIGTSSKSDRTYGLSPSRKVACTLLVPPVRIVRSAVSVPAPWMSFVVSSSLKM